MLLEDTLQTLPVSVLVTVALPLGLLLVLLACLNCFRKKPGGFSVSSFGILIFAEVTTSM